MPRPRDATITFPQGLVSPISPYAGSHLRNLSNCWIADDDWGAVEAMPGFTQFSSGTATGITQMHSIAVGFDVTDFTSKIYVGGNTASECKVYEVDSGAYTQMKAGLDTSNPLHTAQIRNKLVFVNGVDAPFQIDLATDAVTDVGLSQPDVTNASTSLNPGGPNSNNNVRGVVKYWIAEIAAGVEGALSSAFGEIDCGDGNRVDVDLSDPVFTGTYRIYRTRADGTQPRMVYASAAGGAIHKDDVHDNDLGDLPYLHGDPPPEGLIAIVTQFNRLWGLTRAGRLYWCDLIDHNSWWTASDGNWIDIFVDDGDEGTGLAIAPDGIYVFKKAHIYHVYAQQLDGIQVTPISLAGGAQRSPGADRQQAICATREGVAFYHDANVYLLRGLDIRPIGDAIAEDLRGALAFTPTVSLGYSDRRSHLWVSLMNDEISLIYDFARRQWVGKLTYGFRGFAETAANFFGVGGGGATDQTIHANILYAGTDANGDAMTVTCELAPFFGNNPISDKQFLRADLLLNRETTDSDISFVSIFDSDTGSPISVTVPLDESGSSQTRIRRRVNLGYRGREVTFRVTSASANPAWKLYAVSPQWQEYGSSSRRL